MTDWLTVHTGDCRDVLPTLPAQSVHCVVTSPPYWGLRDYGIEHQIGRRARAGLHRQPRGGVSRGAKDAACADDGTLWLNLGDSYTPGGGHTAQWAHRPKVGNTPGRKYGRMVIVHPPVSSPKTSAASPGA